MALPGRFRLAAALPTVSGDRIQLQQVVLNLIANAMEATRSTKGGPQDILISTESADSNRILVVVRDTGIGLKSDEGDLIFEPFYTTKPEGMGMGLAISRSIIEALGGRIWVEPASPRGTAVHFMLPAT